MKTAIIHLFRLFTGNAHHTSPNDLWNDQLERHAQHGADKTKWLLLDLGIISVRATFDVLKSGRNIYKFQANIMTKILQQLHFYNVLVFWLLWCFFRRLPAGNHFYCLTENQLACSCSRDGCFCFACIIACHQHNCSKSISALSDFSWSLLAANCQIIVVRLQWRGSESMLSALPSANRSRKSVSYTHLTLPTIYSV